MKTRSHTDSRARRMRLGFGVAAVFFLSLVIATLMLLSLANMNYGRMEVERQAAQAASILLSWANDRMNTGADSNPRTEMPDVMERITGFTVFDGWERMALSWGEAVPALSILLAVSEGKSPQPFGDMVVWSRNGIVYYIKSSPVMPGQRRMMQTSPSGAPSGAPDGAPEGMRRFGPMIANASIVLKFDGSAPLRIMYLRQVLIILMGAVFIALILALSWLFRRIQGLQEDLDDQEALARLGTAARRLSHEIRNPLSIILMQTSLLERELGGDYHAALESIGEEARRIESHVRQVRHILASDPKDSAEGLSGDSRGEDAPVAFSGSPEAWLRALVASLPAWQGRVRLLAPRESKPDMPSNLAPAMTHESLRSIVINLVDNALEAYDQVSQTKNREGTVTLGWSLARGEPCRFELDVMDQAGGIPRDLRRTMFKPFVTTKPQGSGVGLNLARDLARAAHGELSYRFEKPRGSCFTLALPLYPRNQARQEDLR